VEAYGEIMINFYGKDKKIFNMIIKPDSSKNGIVKFDENKEAYIIKIKEKAVDNKANRELVKFLSKVLKKRVKIPSGLKSRKKIIETLK